MTTQAPTDETKKVKHRRARGSGSVYKMGRVWWIAYRGPDGKRKAESSESERKGDAERLLQSRVGAREHNLPVIPRAEKLTFNDAAQAVLDDYKINGKRSEDNVKRRLTKHLTPFFGGRRMASITGADVTAFVAHRQQQGIVAFKGKRKGERTGDVSNSEINRELGLLDRIFSLAIKQNRLPASSKPHIPKLREPAARSGFFEKDQVAAVVAHLPAEIQPVVEFAYITGWRLQSEIAPLEWRQVDFTAGEVRLNAGTTKNGEGRVFPMTADLRALLKAREVEHDLMKKTGLITPLVFFRIVAKGRGGAKEVRRIKAFTRVWRQACIAAGCPGRIPHDLRRSAIRTFVRKGISESVAMRLSGHKTRSVFDRYNIVSNGDLRAAARALDAPTPALNQQTGR
jgi:integrase